MLPTAIQSIKYFECDRVNPNNRVKKGLIKHLQYPRPAEGNQDISSEACEWHLTFTERQYYNVK